MVKCTIAASCLPAFRKQSGGKAIGTQTGGSLLENCVEDNIEHLEGTPCSIQPCHWDTASNGTTEEPSPEIECQRPSASQIAEVDQDDLETFEVAKVTTTVTTTVEEVTLMKDGTALVEDSSEIENGVGERHGDSEAISALPGGVVVLTTQTGTNEQRDSELPRDSELARVAQTADGSCLFAGQAQMSTRSSLKPATVELDKPSLAEDADDDINVTKSTDEGEARDAQSVSSGRSRALTLPIDIRRVSDEQNPIDDCATGATASQGSTSAEPRPKDPEVQQVSELEQILALRRAGTTHENYPEQSVAGPKASEANGGSLVVVQEEQEDNQHTQQVASENLQREEDNQHVPEATQENPWRGGSRFDFGLGLARCGDCKIAISKSLPRFNRGCSQCKMRICKRCFPNHVCQQLESVHVLTAEEARSAPVVVVV